MSPAEQAVLGDKLREIGLPSSLVARLIAVDELYYCAERVARFLGTDEVRQRIGIFGPGSTMEALDALNAVVNRLTDDPICYCGSPESDWNEHQAPHGNHAFVDREEVATWPSHQQP